MDREIHDAIKIISRDMRELQDSREEYHDEFGLFIKYMARLRREYHTAQEKKLVKLQTDIDNLLEVSHQLTTKGE